MTSLFTEALLAPTCPPEELRTFEVTCHCGKSAMAQVPQQFANRGGAHFCECGAIFAVKRDERGTVKDDQGQSWLVARVPEDIRRVVMGALESLTQGYLN